MGDKNPALFGYHSESIPPMLDTEPPPMTLNSSSFDSDIFGNNQTIEASKDDWCDFSGFVSTNTESQSVSQWGNFSPPPLPSLTPPSTPKNEKQENTQPVAATNSDNYSSQLLTSVKQESTQGQSNEDESVFGLFFKDDSNGENTNHEFGDFSATDDAKSSRNDFDNVYFKNDTCSPQPENFFESPSVPKDDSSVNMDDFASFSSFSTTNNGSHVDACINNDIELHNPHETPIKNKATSVIGNPDSDSYQSSQSNKDSIDNLSQNKSSDNLFGDFSTIDNISNDTTSFIDYNTGKKADNIKLATEYTSNVHNKTSSADIFPNDKSLGTVELEQGVEIESSGKKELMNENNKGVDFGNFGAFQTQEKFDISQKDCKEVVYIEDEMYSNECKEIEAASVILEQSEFLIDKHSSGQLNDPQISVFPESTESSFSDFSNFNTNQHSVKPCEKEDILLTESTEQISSNKDTNTDNNSTAIEIDDFIQSKFVDETSNLEFGIFDSNQGEELSLKTSISEDDGSVENSSIKDKESGSGEFGAFDSNQDESTLKTCINENISGEDKSLFGEFGAFDSNQSEELTVETNFGENGRSVNENISSKEMESSFREFEAFDSNQDESTLRTSLSENILGKENSSFGEFGASDFNQEKGSTLKTSIGENISSEDKESSFGEFGAFDSNQDEELTVKTAYYENGESVGENISSKNMESSFGEFGAFDSNQEKELGKSSIHNNESIGDFGSFDSNTKCDVESIQEESVFGDFDAFNSKQVNINESEFGDFGSSNQGNDFSDFDQAKDTSFGDFGTFDSQKSIENDEGVNNMNSDTGECDVFDTDGDFGDFGTFETTTTTDESQTEKANSFASFETAPSTDSWASFSTTSDQQERTKSVKTSVLFNGCSKALSSSFGTPDLNNRDEDDSSKQRIYELVDHLKNSYQPDSELTLWDELHMAENDDERWLLYYFISNSFKNQILSFNFDYKEIKMRAHQKSVGRFTPTLSPATSIGSFDMEFGILVPEQANFISKNTLLAQSQNKKVSSNLIERIPSLSSLKKEDDSEPTSETASLDLDFFMSGTPVARTTSAPLQNNSAKESCAAQDLVDIVFIDQKDDTTTSQTHSQLQNELTEIPSSHNTEMTGTTQQQHATDEVFGDFTSTVKTIASDSFPTTESIDVNIGEKPSTPTMSFKGDVSLNSIPGVFEEQTTVSIESISKSGKYAVFDAFNTEPPPLEKMAADTTTNGSSDSQISFSSFERLSEPTNSTTTTIMRDVNDKYSVFSILEREPPKLEPESNTKVEPISVAGIDNTKVQSSDAPDFSDFGSFSERSAPNSHIESHKKENFEEKADFGESSSQSVSTEMNDKGSEFADFSPTNFNLPQSNNVLPSHTGSINTVNSMNQDPMSSSAAPKNNITKLEDDFGNFSSGPDTTNTGGEQFAEFKFSTKIKASDNVFDEFAGFSIDKTTVDNTSETNEFGDFGNIRKPPTDGKPTSFVASDFGDFDNAPIEPLDSNFNAFEDKNKVNGTDKLDFGNFGDFNNVTPLATNSSQRSQIITPLDQQNFGDFSNFSSTSNATTNTLSTQQQQKQKYGIPKIPVIPMLNKKDNSSSAFGDFSLQQTAVASDNNSFADFTQNPTLPDAKAKDTSADFGAFAEHSKPQIDENTSDFANFSEFASASSTLRQPIIPNNLEKNINDKYAAFSSLSQQSANVDTDNAGDNFSAFSTVSQPSSSTDKENPNDKYSAFSSLSGTELSSFSDPVLTTSVTPTISSNPNPTLQTNFGAKFPQPSTPSANDTKISNHQQSAQPVAMNSFGFASSGTLQSSSATTIPNTENTPTPSNSVVTNNFGDFKEISPSSETTSRLDTSFGEFSQFSSSGTVEDSNFADFSTTPSSSQDATKSFGTFAGFESGFGVQQNVGNVVNVFGDAPDSKHSSFGDFSTFNSITSQRSSKTNTTSSSSNDFGDFGSFSGTQSSSSTSTSIDHTTNNNTFGDFQNVSQMNSFTYQPSTTNIQPQSKFAQPQQSSVADGFADFEGFQTAPQAPGGQHSMNFQNQFLSKDNNSSSLSNANSYQPGTGGAFSNSVQFQQQQYFRSSFQQQARYPTQTQTNTQQPQNFRPVGNMFPRQQLHHNQYNQQQQQQQQQRFIQQTPRTITPRQRFHQPVPYQHGNDPFASLTLAKNAEQLHIPVNKSSFQKPKKTLNDMSLKP